MSNDIEIEEFLGLTFTDIKVSDDEILFTEESGKVYRMYHSQDCCESVYIEDICGDINSLIGYPILKAAEIQPDLPCAVKEYADESWTWTFYDLATVKGFATIRWYGSSNGWYSESVSIQRIK